MDNPSKAQQWLEGNRENPAVAFLTEWITKDLQRPLESVENIEIIPDNPDAPTVLEFRVDFADGTTQSRTVQVEE